MNDKIPIKRSKTLYPLSHEHHQGLLLCWKIRSGYKKSIQIERIKAYTDWFYKNNLLPHFNLEENFIFPLLGNDNDLVKKAITDHRRLKRLFEDTSDINKSLSLIEEELEKHIRFEERILFNEIEKTASNNELEMIMKIHSIDSSREEWDDLFWE